MIDRIDKLDKIVWIGARCPEVQNASKLKISTCLADQRIIQNILIGYYF